MLEVLARRHYREYDLHDLQSLESGARPFVVADYTLDDRPTRLVSTVGTVAELGDPSGDLVTTWSALTSTARREGEDAVVDLYLHWADAPEAADETSERLRARWSGAAGRSRRTTASRRGLRRRRPPGRLLRVPPRPTTASRRRGRPHPRRAPDGRPAPEPVAAAQLPRDPRRGARGRAALRVRRAGEPRRPATGGPGPGPPDVRRPRRVRHGHRRLPHAERAVENCLESIRRARVARGSRRREARHEPRLGPRLAGRRGRRDRADRAGHQDQPAHRRRRHRGGRGPGSGGRPGRRPASGGRALRRAARRRGGLQRRGAADRAAQPARRLRLEGGPVPPPRTRLPLRAQRRAHRSRWLARRARPRRHRASWSRSTAHADSTRPASSPPW